MMMMMIIIIIIIITVGRLGLQPVISHCLETRGSKFGKEMEVGTFKTEPK